MTPAPDRELKQVEFSTSLKSSRIFRRIFVKGQHAVTKRMVLYCRRNNLDMNRVGITVSTKLGGAVCRNRIRRRLREVYRTNEAGFLRGYDIIAVARRGIISAQYRDIESDFIQLAETLGIRK